eukprot:7807440-Alexandrium_andersonii.AAC.1
MGWAASLLPGGGGPAGGCGTAGPALCCCPPTVLAGGCSGTAGADWGTVGWAPCGSTGRSTCGACADDGSTCDAAAAALP